MKKLLLITLLMCFIGTFTACGNESPKLEKDSLKITGVTGNVEDNVPEQEAEETNGNKAQEGTSSDNAKEPKNDSLSENTEATGLPNILSLKQTYSVRNEWQDDIWMLFSEGSNVTMWEGADKYPEMDHLLSEREGMQKRSMTDEADNILSFAQEMFDVNSESFETQVSTLDVQVRRADSVVVSLLSDSYADYGFIRDVRGMWGSNYDVQTGKELLLSDVIIDMEPIPGIILEELNSHIWAGDDYSETVVEEYFKNTPKDGISWTLDYNGVTFYFGDGDLAEAGNGGVSATVSFAEYPELFQEKYKSVPEAYMVRLPLDSSFFTDLDGDKTLEELNCTGLYNEADRCYTKFGIYTNSDGCYQYEEMFSYGFQPYYVKAENGKHYIYLFCEEVEGGNRQMMLVVYNVNNGVLSRVGEMNIAPAYIPSDTFVLPLDPNHLLLDYYDGLSQDAEVYMVGSDGMPEKKYNDSEEAVSVDNVKNCYREEITEYFDVEPAAEEQFDIESLIPVDGNEVEVADTYYAYMMVDQQSGDTVYYPHFTLQLSEDGTGYCETESETFEFTWHCEEDGTLTLEGDRYYYLTPYLDQADGYERVWFMMQMDESVIWLY